MSRGTLDTAVLTRFSLTGLSPSLAGLSRTVLLTLFVTSAVRTPARTLVWALPFSLAATHRIDIFSFSSSGYLDVSVHRVPSAYLWIQYTVTEVCSAGFPHSDICGSRDICSSPQLFAAYRVFHRLLVPRHPPCALYSLTCCNSSFMVSLPAYIALYAFYLKSSFLLLVLDVFSFIFFYPVGSYKPTF